MIRGTERLALNVAEDRSLYIEDDNGFDGFLCVATAWDGVFIAVNISRDDARKIIATLTEQLEKEG